MKIDNTAVLAAASSLLQPRSRMRQVMQCMAMTVALTSLFTAVQAQQRDPLPASVQAPAATAFQATGHRWVDVPTQTLSAGGVDFAYRELGKHHGGTPVLLLVHLAAVLDNWDPRIVDGLAARHHVTPSSFCSSPVRRLASRPAKHSWRA